jgi:dual specificity tyrosine-phosphorylation-regulated kinase 2/3/4
MLEQNLYEFLKINGFNGFPLDLVRRFTIQVLQCLMFLERNLIVHCDLKPENILLKHENKSGIKIIDFGSGCFERERIYTYIQSRFYRAPEIILGIEYTTAIDMWSLGCIICELYLGYPIFPGESEIEQLALFMEVLDVPPRSMIERGQRKRRFFDESLEPKPTLNSKGKQRKYGSKTIEGILKCKDKDFINFIRSCLEW